MASTPSPAQNKPQSSEPPQQAQAQPQISAIPQSQPPAVSQKGKNFGEWAEAYVLLNILAEGKLPILQDKKTSPTEVALADTGAFIGVDRVFLERGSETIEYRLGKKNGHPLGTVERVEIFESGNHVATVNQPQLADDLKLFDNEKTNLKISKSSSKSKGSVSSQTLTRMLSTYWNVQGKTKSSLKQDIELVLFDPGGNTLPKKGFSIKSWVSEPPTIFNASQSTRFCYKLADNALSKANSIAANCWKEKAGKKEFQVVQFFQELDQNNLLTDDDPIVKTTSFRSNLELLGGKDVALIMGRLLKYRLVTGTKKIQDLLARIIQDNPLGDPTRVIDPYYRCRISRFLRAAALGMQASQYWEGGEGAEGGMILVSRDWKVGCYMAGQEDFEHYLISGAYIEIPACGKTKSGIPYISNLTEGCYVDCALQIRERSPF